MARKSNLAESRGPGGIGGRISRKAAQLGPLGVVKRRKSTSRPVEVLQKRTSRGTSSARTIIKSLIIKLTILSIIKGRSFWTPASAGVTAEGLSSFCHSGEGRNPASDGYSILRPLITTLFPSLFSLDPLILFILYSGNK